MHSTLEVRQWKVLVTPEDKDYATPVVCKNSLTNFRSESNPTLVVRKREVLVTPEVRDYATPVVCKNSLTNFSRVSNLTLVVNKCSDIIPCKFKAVKFMIE